VTTPEVASLPEILRRCHRQELLPLAAMVGVNPASMNRDGLARGIQLALRTAGSQQVLDALLRRGDPPPWHEVVRDLAERIGAKPHPDPAHTERAILEAWLGKGKPRPVPKDEIAEILTVNPWGEPTTALQPIGRSPLKKQIGGPLLAAIGRLLVPMLGPGLVLGILLWLGRPRDSILLPAILEIARLRVRVKHRYVVALVGPPSVGKDAAIKALFGFDTGNVNPIAGSTTDVAVYEVPGDHGIEVINTPGVGDVRQRLTEETRGILDQADLFLFLVNAQGGVRQRERDEYGHVRRMRRPTLVVLNKVDTLKEADRERMVADTVKKLVVPEGDVVGAAFDPLPQLHDAPIGVDAIHAWLADRLEESGRDRDAFAKLLAGAAPRGPARDGTEPAAMS
jgi:GTP-binding protein EngB required for normal cell division